jgi:hypothetical protein
MKRTAKLGLVAVLLLGACSGVDIRPISPTLAAKAHGEEGAASGYVVYGPMVVVEVSRVCVVKDAKGACRDDETRCAAGAPFVLPDFTKPFLVDVRNGFGKAGVDLTIADGWRLAGIKDQSDNTAILGAIEKLALARMAEPRTASEGALRGGCAAPGLYRVELTPTGMALNPLRLYLEPADPALKR